MKFTIKVLRHSPTTALRPLVDVINERADGVIYLGVVVWKDGYIWSINNWALYNGEYFLDFFGNPLEYQLMDSHKSTGRWAQPGEEVVVTYTNE